MVLDTYQFIGVIGLLIIISAVLITKPKLRKRAQYPLFIIGGICLIIYSIYIQDKIFIALQAIFTIAAMYGLYKIHRHEIQEALGLEKPVKKKKAK